ncbi:hypothetical protein EDB19DRAFT_1839887, partial [Suillus lakei]
GMDIGNPVLRDALKHPILATEPAWNTPANRESMAEIMFEEFHVPAFYIANTGILNAPSHRPQRSHSPPHQLIAKKSPVEPGAPPKFTLRKDRISGMTVAGGFGVRVVKLKSRYRTSLVFLIRDGTTVLRLLVQHATSDLQQVLMGNVVLTGGGSLLPGPADRLETELSRNFPHLLCSIVYRGDLAQVLRGVPGVLAQWPESWLIGSRSCML